MIGAIGEYLAKGWALILAAALIVTTAILILNALVILGGLSWNILHWLHVY